jgi:hypothetical protein
MIYFHDIRIFDIVCLLVLMGSFRGWKQNLLNKKNDLILRMNSTNSNIVCLLVLMGSFRGGKQNS